MTLGESFKALLAALPSSEHQSLLLWESFWYGPAQGDTRFADDAKRETLPLTLGIDGATLGAVRGALAGLAVNENAARQRLEIELPNRERQPERLVLSAQNIAWLPKNATITQDSIHLSDQATLVEILQTAVLLARFPQISAACDAKIDAKAALDLTQGLRRHFFKHIIMGRRVSAALLFLDRMQLLDTYLPEVTAGRHLTQNRYHAHDIFDHLLHSVDGAFDLNEPVRWSALLHDIGKVPTRVEGSNGEASFHSHEIFSARMIVPIMKRLGVPIGIGQKVKFLVRNHMFHYTDEWTDKAVRRFVKKIPLEELQDLIALRLADRKGSGKKSAFPRALQNLINHIDEIIEKEREFKIKDLAIDGHILMDLGMPRTRAMGDMLKYLCDEVKAERLENTREALIHAVQNRLSESGMRA